ncbi:MAG: outer membrane lipoprotein LolB [Halothiobacillaceae bacterium]|nr:MAG: outer membrane lipoprotein LolB [Halothiobacillaceae bacterium]
MMPGMSTIQGRLLRVLALGSLILLGGCATAPMIQEETDPQRIGLWRSHQQQLQAIQQWQIEGRAAILAQGTGGQVAFDWSRATEQQVLNIKTPLGQNVLQLTHNAKGVVLVDHEGEIHQGTDGEALLRETLGWSVPFEAMHAWLLGLPATGNDAYSLDPEGRILRMHSHGWRIEYQRYTTLNGVALPSKMELTHMDLTLRLIVDRWRL